MKSEVSLPHCYTILGSDTVAPGSSPPTHVLAEVLATGFEVRPAVSPGCRPEPVVFAPRARPFLTVARLPDCACLGRAISAVPRMTAWDRIGFAGRAERHVGSPRSTKAARKVRALCLSRRPGFVAPDIKKREKPGG